MTRTHLPILTALLLFAACGDTTMEASGGTDAAPAESPAYKPSPPPENGPYEARDAEGRLLMKGNYRNGRRHGVWTSYNAAGGVKSRTSYADGREEGSTVVYHDNGMVYYSGDYAAGTPVGEWKFYDQMGDLVRTVQYDDEGNLLSDQAANDR